MSVINLLRFPAKWANYFSLKPFFNEIFCHTLIIREFFNEFTVRHVLLLSFSRSSVMDYGGVTRLKYIVPYLVRALLKCPMDLQRAGMGAPTPQETGAGERAYKSP